MVEEIDLRVYVNVLLSWWREIIIFTLFCAVLSWGGSSLRPSIYQATAKVAVVKEETSVNLGSQFGTLSESDLAGGKYLDPKTRRTALADLVRNITIAERVIPDLTDQWLEEDERDPSVLVGKVDGNVGQGSDLILIQVKDRNPEKAAYIATVWARTYVDFVNQLYNDTAGSYVAVGNQLAESENAYREAQSALENFITGNRIDELNRLISEKNILIDVLQSDKQMAFSTFFESDWNEDIISLYIDAELAKQITTFQQSREEGSARFSSALEERLGNLARNYSLKSRYERLLKDVVAMRNHLDAGGDPASNALALTLLKGEIFASSTGLPGDLQIQLDTPVAPTLEDQKTDLDALVVTLSSYIEDLDASNKAESAEILEIVDYGFNAVAVNNPDDAQNVMITTLQAEVQQLKAELEAQQAQKRELTEVRDLAWDGYTTLARREAELRVSQQISDSEVRFAAPASVPRGPLPTTSLKFIVLVSVAVGFAFSVFMAFFLSYLDQPPLLQLVFKKRKS